jgi:hypothetical protein
MRDLDQQLADYFDATVERITAEDVLIGARSRAWETDERPIRTASRRPAWAIAVAFVATIVVVSGSLGVGLFLRASSTPVGAGGTALAETASGTTSPWIFIGGALAALAAIAVAATARVMTAEGRNGGTSMTVTTERPAADDRIHKLTNRNRTLTIAVIVLAILAIGLGAWAVYEATASESAGPAEVTDLTDEWFAANEAADGSVTAMYSTNGYHQYGIQQFRGDEIAAHLSAAPNNEFEWIGEAVVLVDSGDGRWVTARPMRITSGFGVFESIISFEVIRAADGELLLAQTEWLYDHGNRAQPTE